MRRKTTNQAWTLHKVKRSWNSLLLSKNMYKPIAFGPSMVKTSVNERAMISKLNVFFLLVNCKTLMIVNKFPARIKKENTNRTTITVMWISEVSLSDARFPFALSASMFVKQLCNSSFSSSGKIIPPLDGQTKQVLWAVRTNILWPQISTQTHSGFKLSSAFSISLITSKILEDVKKCLEDHAPTWVNYMKWKKEIENSIQNWTCSSQICCFHLQSAVKCMRTSDWLKYTLIVKLEK